ncbi:MAG TPA: hypothetical protein VMU95_33370 [Trebonia sp.]|nr:hypothetical protein [Trebonia sp.]
MTNPTTGRARQVEAVRGPTARRVQAVRGPTARRVQAVRGPTARRVQAVTAGPPRYKPPAAQGAAVPGPDPPAYRAG